MITIQNKSIKQSKKGKILLPNYTSKNNSIITTKNLNIRFNQPPEVSNSNWIGIDAVNYIDTTANIDHGYIIYNPKSPLVFHNNDQTNLWNKNDVIIIDQIQFSDYNLIYYNWSEKDFIQLDGIGTGLTFCTIFEVGQFSTAYDGQQVIDGSVSDVRPLTGNISINELIAQINNYLNLMTGGDFKIETNSYPYKFISASNNEYKIKITNLLQVLIFGVYTGDDIVYVPKYGLQLLNLTKTNKYNNIGIGFGFKNDDQYSIILPENKDTINLNYTFIAQTNYIQSDYSTLKYIILDRQNNITQYSQDNGYSYIDNEINYHGNKIPKSIKLRYKRISNVYVL